MREAKDLPETLWRSGLVHLWPDLLAILRAELNARDRLVEAGGPYMDQKEINKGERAEVSEKHFTHRFYASAIRLHYLMLNHDGTFDHIESQLTKSLYDGVVGMIDVPCGSGGGVLGLLCSLAALRVQGAIPKLPLEVRILAGDICRHAMAIHRIMIGRIRPFLNDAGIEVVCEHAEWDVLNQLSTVALLKRFDGIYPGIEEIVILISAFSDFISQGKSGASNPHLDRVKEAIGDMVKYTYEKDPTIAWIEPRNDDVTKNYNALLEFLLGIFRRPKTKLEIAASVSATFFYQHPFNDQRIKGTVQVLPIEKLAGSQK